MGNLTYRSFFILIGWSQCLLELAPLWYFTFEFWRLFQHKCTFSLLIRFILSQNYIEIPSNLVNLFVQIICRYTIFYFLVYMGIFA